ncbi:nuclear transport factor 2 family protein [Kibdelosporangium phytohabitans]|uniref:SnoaL-like domain-containing protein n=1 Tax=Kibdelosporangium phytohabitans TaxID=860235 RepID=A0A0N9I417_9PSEU|nr:nuclear transport factor 2 family protein [Kibdelosporangium phytohabitans]ALG10400.1 hypothetical protein AOZ06_29045 [Kibdelosporangium phytohabitans]MBE1461461.1 putative SnoaL-like aldol condensation-catalyzing enzyme [Kibdelosporangium phytohabitans]
MAMSDVEQNKRTVLAFVDMAFNAHKPREAADRYIGAEYVQHDPHVADGPDGFVTSLSGYLERFPEISFDSRRVVAEGDLVVVHGLLKSSPEDRQGTVCMDIFRVAEGKIVEHWDVMQQVPEASVHSNAMV